MQTLNHCRTTAVLVSGLVVANRQIVRPSLFVNSFVTLSWRRESSLVFVESPEKPALLATFLPRASRILSDRFDYFLTAIEVERATACSCRAYVYAIVLWSKRN